jgi:hypothetical protein
VACILSTGAEANLNETADLIDCSAHDARCATNGRITNTDDLG